MNTLMRQKTKKKCVQEVTRNHWMINVVLLLVTVCQYTSVSLLILKGRKMLRMSSIKGKAGWQMTTTILTLTLNRATLCLWFVRNTRPTSQMCPISWPSLDSISQRKLWNLTSLYNENVRPQASHSTACPGSTLHWWSRKQEPNVDW